MDISNASRIMLGLIIITIPTIQYGGYFLLTEMGKGKVIKSELQRAYYRAGHAHAGVLVLLALLSQILVEFTSLSDVLAWVVRGGAASAPILISAGFFGGAPAPDSTTPRPLIRLIYVGVVALATSMIVLGLGLIFQ